MKLITVTLNPAVDATVTLDRLERGHVHRAKSIRHDAGARASTSLPAWRTGGWTSPPRACWAARTPASSRALFRAKRIEDRFVRADGATRTNIKLVDSDATTDINLPGLTATGELLTEAEATLLTLAEPGALVVLAGSLPLGCPPDHYGRLIARLQSGACAYCWTPAAMRWPMRWPAPPCPGPSSPTATNWPNGRASR